MKDKATSQYILAHPTLYGMEISFERPRQGIQLVLSDILVQIFNAHSKALWMLSDNLIAGCTVCDVVELHTKTGLQELKKKISMSVDFELYTRSCMPSKLKEVWSM